MHRRFLSVPPGCLTQHWAQLTGVGTTCGNSECMLHSVARYVASQAESASSILVAGSNLMRPASPLRTGRRAFLCAVFVCGVSGSGRGWGFGLFDEGRVTKTRNFRRILVIQVSSSGRRERCCRRRRGLAALFPDESERGRPSLQPYTPTARTRRGARRASRTACPAASGRQSRRASRAARPQPCRAAGNPRTARRRRSRCPQRGWPRR